jgi:hypothetical protein
MTLMVPRSSRGHSNPLRPFPLDALQDQCSRLSSVWANQVRAGSLVEYVRVLSLHRPVPWEIVPCPTSASSFTVPTRRAIIEGTLDWLTCYRRYTFIRGQLFAPLHL